MAVPDVRAMTPAQRGKVLSRAVGVKRRLEARQRNGLLTAAQAALLREARLTLSALANVDIALRGTNVTLAQARKRRTELRTLLGIRGRRTSGGRITVPANLQLTRAHIDAARAELAAIEAALTTAQPAGRASDAAALKVRTQPTRVTSVVQGGSPGLGRR